MKTTLGLGPVVHEPHVPLPCAGRSVSHGGKKQSEVESFELELQPARNPPAFLDVSGDLLVQLRHDVPSEGAGLAGIVDRAANEQAVGVPVDDPEPPLLESIAAPEQDLPTESRDRVRELRRGEAASPGTEHSVERVHEDLDRLARRLVACLLRDLPSGEELVEQLGEYPRLP